MTSDEHTAAVNGVAMDADSGGMCGHINYGPIIQYIPVISGKFELEP